MKPQSSRSLSVIFAASMLLEMALPSLALDVPLSFQLTPSASAVAVQFDLASSVSGVTLAAPLLEGAAPHVVDSQLQANGATRYVVYSTSNTILAPAGTVKVTLGVQQALLQDNILSVSGVVASDSNGASVSASPGAIPVVMSVNPSSLAKAAVGRNIPVGVEVVDLDGTVSSVSFRLNGSTVVTDTSRPFANALTSPTAGDFSYSVQALDNQGKISLSNPVTLQFINPASLATFSSFQAAWLGGTGSFNADSFGNGIPNGLAWAFGIDPRDPDRSRLPTHFIEDSGGGKFLVYRARVLASGIVPQILASTILAQNGWSAVPPGQITETLESGGWRLVEARLPITGATPRQFAKLRVEQP
jgi:hypothetical protein